MIIVTTLGLSSLCSRHSPSGDDHETKPSSLTDKTVPDVSFVKVFAALAPIPSPTRFPKSAPCLLHTCTDEEVTADSHEIARKIGKTPVWIFHGAKDPVVPVDEARQMFTLLRSLGANVRYTEYADIGHRCWKQAYAEPELLPWLLNQHRGQ
jgi:pimeloyl-ACP methyl ester carboxylesterase